MLRWYVAPADALIAFLVACRPATGDRTMTVNDAERCRKMPKACPDPPRRTHTEPCFMERNRKDAATLETHAPMRYCAICCASAMLAHEAWVMPLTLAHEALPLFAAVCGLLVLCLRHFMPLCRLTNDKIDKKICRNIYVICNITHYNLFSSPLKYLFTNSPKTGHWLRQNRPTTRGRQSRKSASRASPNERKRKDSDEVARM